LHDENIIGRGTEVCGLYMLDDSIIIGYASVANQNSHGNLEIWDFRLIHVTDMGLIGLVEHGLSADETKLKMLEANISLERWY